MAKKEKCHVCGQKELVNAVCEFTFVQAECKFCGYQMGDNGTTLNQGLSKEKIRAKLAINKATELLKDPSDEALLIIEKALEKIDNLL